MNDKKGEKEQFNKVAELISKTALNINFGLDLAKLRRDFVLIRPALNLTMSAITGTPICHPKKQANTGKIFIIYL